MKPLASKSATFAIRDWPIDRHEFFRSTYVELDLGRDLQR